MSVLDVSADLAAIKSEVGSLFGKLQTEINTLKTQLGISAADESAVEDFIKTKAKAAFMEGALELLTVLSTSATLAPAIKEAVVVVLATITPVAVAAVAAAEPVVASK